MQSGFLKLTKRLLVSYLIGVIAFSSVAGLFLFNPFGTKETAAAWFNDNWAYRKEVPITANAAADTNAFFSFTLDTAALITAGQLQSSCQDIRVTDVSGNVLAYHVGRTNTCNNSTTTIDALAPDAPNSSTPTLPAGASTFYVYYGNPSVTSKDQGAFSQSEAASYTVGALGSTAVGPSPTLYWKFDDGQGTTTQDSSQNNLDGTLNNAVTWQTENFCISGKCLYFPAVNDDSVSKADDDKLDFAAADNFTISAWVRHSGTISSDEDMIISKSSAAGNSFQGYKLYFDNSGDLCFRVGDGTDMASACTSAVDFDDDTWHFVSGVKAGTSAITLYVDGVSRATATPTSVDSLANSGTFYVGVDSGGTWELYGFADEVKVFRDNSARTAAQVLADFNARGNPEGVSVQFGNNTQNMPGALSNGLVGYWKTDETSSTAADSSGNGLTLTNNATTTYVAGKFGNAANFVAASSQYLSTATTITGVKTVSFWTNNASTTDEYINLIASTAYITSSSGTVSATGFTTPTIYVNGVINGTLTASVWNHVVVTSDTGINANAFEVGRGNGAYNNGKIDDIRTYNRALSNNEVTQLYNWAPGPVGYWKMDEGTGTSAVDNSGNANNGTITAGTGAYTNGKYGKGYNFDAANTSINNGSGTTLDNLPASGMSLGAWIYPKSVGEGSAGFILAKNVGTTPSAGWIFQISGTNALTFTVDGSTDLVHTTSSSAITLNTWNYVSVTWDGVITTAATAKIYVNGVEASYATTTNGAARVDDASSTFFIGNDSTSARTFDGYIDESKTYNYARTQAQVVEDMNAGHPAPGSPVGTPLGFWKFDEGYGTTAGNYGRGGSAIAGTLTNLSSPATSTSGWSNNGKFNKALIFEGTAGSSNDLVNMGSDTSLDDLTAKPMSLSAWIYPVSLGEGSAGVIMAKNGNSTSPSAGWLWQMVSTTQLKFSVDGSTDLVVTSSGNPITLNQWNHVALSWDGVFTTASSVHMYVNSREVTYGTQTNGATIVSDAASSLLVGNNNATGLANTFDGYIDEPKVFDEALTADQVKIDMNRASSEVLGALSTSSTAGNDNASTRTAQSGASEYCIPGDATTCTGPVGEWKFDEGTSTTANDSSGTGNTGTLTNTPTWVNGKVNKAINFVNGSDQYVTIPAASSINALGPLTYEAWIYPRSAGQSSIGRIFDKLARTSAGMSNTRIEFDVDYATTDLQRITTDTVTVNQWSHVTITWDGSTTAANVHIYINGKEAAAYTTTTDGNGARQSDAAGAQVIGNRSTDFARDFDGMIDQPKIFNYARSAAQIAWDYNKGGPVAWWKMDECQGTTINDFSGNSNTGTWSGSGGTYTTPGTCSVSSASSVWYNGASGKRNYSLAFDGSDDGVSIPDSNTLDLRTSFTVSAWVYINSVPSNCGSEAVASIFNKGRDSTATYAYNLDISECSSDIGKSAIEIYDGSTQGTALSLSALSLNTWYLLTGTYDGTSLKLYVNGVLNSTTSTSVDPGNQTSTAAIGKNPNASNRYFPGKIDDVRAYNYPMTATQIKTLYNEGATRYGPVTGAP